MTIDINDSFNDFPFKWIESSITSGKLIEWNQNTFVRSNLTVIHRFVTIQRSSVDIHRHSGPSLFVKIETNSFTLFGVFGDG